MLYLLLVLTAILWIIAGFTSFDDIYNRHNDFTEQGTFILGTFIGVISIVAILGCWGVYSYRTETINSQLEVLESQNAIILSQIEPVIQKALDFESNTYKELKVNPENIITLSQIYPDLKDNSFIQTQLSVILTNQQQITQLKLNKATLNAFHFWIWSKRI
jgi:hypothetical protein